MTSQRGGSDERHHIRRVWRRIIMDQDENALVWISVAEPDSGPAPIFVDEFDAGGLKRVANRQVVSRTH
jgi:hypothetical protein